MTRFHQDETQSNRIAIVSWREHDVTYLNRLIREYRRLEARLPNPVPAGQDKLAVFSMQITRSWGVNPSCMAGISFDLMITAYDPPKESFQQVLDSLPSARYTRAH